MCNMMQRAIICTGPSPIAINPLNYFAAGRVGDKPRPDVVCVLQVVILVVLGRWISRLVGVTTVNSKDCFGSSKRGMRVLTDMQVQSPFVHILLPSRVMNDLSSAI